MMDQAFEWFCNPEGHLTTSLGVPYNELFSTQEIRRLTFTRLQISKSQDLPLLVSRRQTSSSPAGLSGVGVLSGSASQGTGETARRASCPVASQANSPSITLKNLPLRAPAGSLMGSWLRLATKLTWTPPLLLAAFLTSYSRWSDFPDGQV
jgi:hypothetical protein